MARQALFAGLVVDENDHIVDTTAVGGESFYVVDDSGFRRHIPSEQVDLQVLRFISGQVEGNEGLISEQAAKMMGQDDIFTRAMIENQLKNIDQQFNAILDVGLPEETRLYIGMTGFKVVINYHGEVVRIDQPSAPESQNGEDE
jgi:hypothetical protein